MRAIDRLPESHPQSLLRISSSQDNESQHIFSSKAYFSFENIENELNEKNFNQLVIFLKDQTLFYAQSDGDLIKSFKCLNTHKTQVFNSKTYPNIFHFILNTSLSAIEKARLIKLSFEILKPEEILDHLSKRDPSNNFLNPLDIALGSPDDFLLISTLLGEDNKLLPVNNATLIDSNDLIKTAMSLNKFESFEFLYNTANKIFFFSKIKGGPNIDGAKYNIQHFAFYLSDTFNQKFLEFSDFKRFETYLDCARTPLMIAINKKNFELVEKMIKEDGLDSCLKSFSEENISPLKYAVMAGNFHMFKKLLRALNHYHQIMI